MAGVRGMLGHRREDGYRHIPDPDLVYLCLLSDHGVAIDHLLYPGILDEYQKIYPFRTQEPYEISLASILLPFRILPIGRRPESVNNIIDLHQREPGLIKDHLFT